MLALALVVSLCLGSKSYGQAFYKHVYNLSGGIGIGGVYNIKETKTDTTGGSSKQISRTIPMKTLALTDGNAWGFSFEYGFKEWKRRGGLGLGGYLGTRRFLYRETDIEGVFNEKSLRFYIVNLEGRYHFYTKSRWDPYISASAGLQLKNVRYLYTKRVQSINKDYNYIPDNNPLIAYAASAGMRYFFANNMAVYSEVGFGYYYAKVGLNLIVKK